MGEAIAPVHSGDLNAAELSRIIGGVLGEAGVGSLVELVRWFENGRRHLLDDLDEAARQLGTRGDFLATVVATRAFRRAYFEYLMANAFNPYVLAEGFGLLAADFTSPDVSPRERLAILKTLGEHVGIAKVEKVEHEVTQKTLDVKVVLATRPEDFIDPARGTDKPPLEASLDTPELDAPVLGDAGRGTEEVIETTFKEADRGEGVT